MQKTLANGTVVNITGLASDADATTNTITYSLQNNDGGRFAIDANSGIVTVAGAINREADGASRNITIRATSADGSFTDQVFSIAIVDANEFAVTAPSDSNAATNAVDENVAIGTLVGITASSSDADATTNAVTYSLFDNDGGNFTIDANSGIVTDRCRFEPRNAWCFAKHYRSRNLGGRFDGRYRLYDQRSTISMNLIPGIDFR